ncbi:MAG: carboxypeptidase-like regulatory domain-containing protein [Planctomycetes bacterium]|nr:carboxypeptidase-like regulatory domain-containing protein [Planctomycetota bacterium]
MRIKLPVLILVLIAIFAAALFLLLPHDSPKPIPVRMEPAVSTETQPANPLEAVQPGTHSSHSKQPNSTALPEEPADAPSAEQPQQEPEGDWSWKDEIPHRYSEPRDTSRHVNLSGHVVDIAGRPVAGATVAVTAAQSQDKYRTRGGLKTLGTTGVDGSFKGDYGLNGTSIVYEIAICAKHNEADSLPTKLIVTPGESIDHILIEMPASSGVTGSVLDSNFQPLERALVVVRPASNGERRNPLPVLGTMSVSDAEGRFAVSGLQGGDYVITVDRAGYAPARVEVSIAPGVQHELTQIILAPTTALRLRLVCEGRQPKGRFTATFYSGDGSAVARTSAADPGGHALINDVPPGAVEVVIAMPGFSDSSRIPMAPIDGAHVDLGEIKLTRRD